MNESNQKTPRGWYSRGYLPHYDGGSITQFITCRLFDSLPQKVLHRFRVELETKNVEDISRETMILIEKYLDAGYGECFLKNVEVAKTVRDSLLKYDGERYKLFSWVIMPNHIHLLLKPINDWELEKIFHSFKSFTALESNKILNRTGKFWMREAFDRRIRDAEHFGKAFRYIENNPVKRDYVKTRVIGNLAVHMERNRNAVILAEIGTPSILAAMDAKAFKICLRTLKVF